MNIDFAIMQVESGGNPNLTGDLHLADRAYGPMQIRQPVCDDVNAAYGTHFRAQDMLGYTAKCFAVFWLYMSIYATTTNLGRPPTNEDRARIWNGGPTAWNPSSKLYVATTPYWNKVRAFLS
jgi:hypothetical protein